MENVKLIVSPREGTGKGVARKLRQKGSVPAIVYARTSEPTCVSFTDEAWRKAIHDGLRIGRLVELQWDQKKKSKELALVRDVQVHPVTDKTIHVDFQLVTKGEEMELEVPLSLIGTAVGVKDEGGSLDFHLRRIKVRCLPSNIPEEIQLDITNLKAGESLHVSDIDWTDGHILMDDALAVVSVEHPREIEEEVEEEEEVEVEEGVESETEEEE